MLQVSFSLKLKKMPFTFKYMLEIHEILLKLTWWLQIHFLKTLSSFVYMIAQPVKGKNSFKFQDFVWVTYCQILVWLIVFARLVGFLSRMTNRIAISPTPCIWISKYPCYTHFLSHEASFQNIVLCYTDIYGLHKRNSAFQKNSIGCL